MRNFFKKNIQTTSYGKMKGKKRSTLERTMLRIDEPEFLKNSIILAVGRDEAKEKYAREVYFS